jgi:hypothetical protein
MPQTYCHGPLNVSPVRSLQFMLKIRKQVEKEVKKNLKISHVKRTHQSCQLKNNVEGLDYFSLT